MKQKAQKDAAAEGGGTKKKKVTAAQLRVQKGEPHLHLYISGLNKLPRILHGEQALTSPDLSEMALGSTMRTDFSDPDDILNFTLTIDPDEGMYKGGTFKFTFVISNNYPHDPPKVKCTQKIYHPNIDLEGNVCLNILREDWKPVLSLNAVVVGMQVCSRSRGGLD